MDRRDPGLDVEALTVQFGGLVAVDDVTLHAPVGRLTGLIGPNGAGKTTLFNACTGLVAPTSGTVRVAGRDVTAMRPARRAQLGLGRTFQHMELFDSATVVENVALGRESALAGRRLVRQLWASRGEDREVREHTARAMELCGLDDVAEQPVGTLPTGKRRLVELARVLAGPFHMLLLDEPSSGLGQDETERFGDVLQTVLTDRDVGILLVEHDMALVMRVCDHIHVLDAGALLFEGTPEETAASEAVRGAYLGAEAA